METIASIDLSASGSPSVIMRDLSEYSTLPFLASFDIPTDAKTQTPPKRITYVALAKKTMPLLVEHFLRFKDRTEIYADGTLEAVLSVRMIPSHISCTPSFAHRPIPYRSNSSTTVRHRRSLGRICLSGKQLRRVSYALSRSARCR